MKIDTIIHKTTAFIRTQEDLVAACVHIKLL